MFYKGASATVQREMITTEAVKATFPHFEGNQGRVQNSTNLDSTLSSRRFRLDVFGPWTSLESYLQGSDFLKRAVVPFE